MRTVIGTVPSALPEDLSSNTDPALSDNILSIYSINLLVSFYFWFENGCLNQWFFCSTGLNGFLFHPEENSKPLNSCVICLVTVSPPPTAPPLSLLWHPALPAPPGTDLGALNRQDIIPILLLASLQCSHRLLPHFSKASIQTSHYQRGPPFIYPIQTVASSNLTVANILTWRR